MSEAKPILFSAAMVRAILDGRKTMTRRVLNPQPSAGVRRSPFVQSGVEDGHGREVRLRYYPGDLLWVKETHRLTSWNEDGQSFFEYPADGEISPGLWHSEGFDWDAMIDRACAAYRKAGVPMDEHGYYAPGEFKLPLRPSIFMPRWASRLTLEVTGVKVERLQDISEADAEAEGVTKVRDHCYVIRGFDYDLADLCHSSPVTPFAKLWDSLNAKPKPIYDSGRIVSYVSYPWDGEPRTEIYSGRPHIIAPNPWVAAVSFRAHKQNVDAFMSTRMAA